MNNENNKPINWKMPPLQLRLEIRARLIATELATKMLMDTESAVQIARRAVKQEAAGVSR